VVEAEHVKEALIAGWRIPAESISVIPNTLNPLVLKAPEDLAIPAPSPGIKRVCYVTRPYPHKNLGILPLVAKKMRYEHGIPVEFVLTLTPGEWRQLDQDVRSCAINVGSVSVHQLASVYAASDASIFPSLLESFSVTPLEALATGTPLVASARPFVRGICGTAPWYAEPTDAADLAKALMAALVNPMEAKQRVKLGHEVIAGHPNAYDRCVLYLQLVDQLICRSRPSDSRVHGEPCLPSPGTARQIHTNPGVVE
jgi:glycosyltransferase involved in cell wall biosynthesis